MSEQVVGNLITLHAEGNENAFEAFLIQQSKDVLAQNPTIHFLFFKRVGALRQYVWLTRFPESEFERVDRAAHPIVLRAVKDLLAKLPDQKAQIDGAFSTEVQTLKQLQDRWNKEFGNFGPIFPPVS
jgi:hypothetical protein